MIKLLRIPENFGSSYSRSSPPKKQSRSRPSGSTTAFSMSVRQPSRHPLYPLRSEEELQAERNTVCGTTVGNTTNEGMVAYSGGWIYYLNPDDFCLYKARADGTGKGLHDNHRRIEPTEAARKCL